MIKKHHLLLLLIAFSLIFALHAADDESTQSQIERLEKELDHYRKQAVNEELNAQQSMRTDWSKFTQDINQSEETEKHVLDLKKQIQELKQQQSQSQQPSSRP